MSWSAEISKIHRAILRITRARCTPAHSLTSPCLLDATVGTHPRVDRLPRVSKVETYFLFVGRGLASLCVHVWTTGPARLLAVVRQHQPISNDDY
jgi:hypothetical protein